MVEKKGMTKYEVYKHLNGLSNSEKIRYLNTILTKKGLLAPETKKNIVGLIAGIYIKNKSYEQAGDVYNAEGNSGRAKELYSKQIAEEKREHKVWPNPHSYSHAGTNPEGAYLTHEGELLRKAGQTREARDFYLKLAKESSEGDYPNARGAAIGYYLAAGEYDGAKMLGWKRPPRQISERKAFLTKVKEKRRGTLEKRLLPVLTIASLASAVFFLSANLTGNAIADLTTKTTSFLGAGLLIVGLVAGFFWVRSRKK